MIFAPDSGGWSEPIPEERQNIASPRAYQLYDLEKAPSERQNLYEDNLEIAKELEKMMINIIKNGRSTAGQNQQNDAPMNDKELKQIERFKIPALQNSSN